MAWKFYSIKFIGHWWWVLCVISERRLRNAYEKLKKRGISLASNQVNYSLIYQAPEDNGVKATCDELGISLIAYSPIAQGELPTLNGLAPFFFLCYIDILIIASETQSLRSPIGNKMCQEKHCILSSCMLDIPAWL